MFRFTDLIIFRLTRDCNLNCKYCFMTNKSEFKGEIISQELFEHIVDEIIKARIVQKRKNELTFIFHGGEALLVGKERFAAYCEYITSEFSKHDLEINLGTQTNATLIDDEYAKILKKYNVNVGMSFDGIAGSNSERDVKEEIFEQKFEILEQNDLGYGFIVVAGKHNIDKLKESTEYLQNLEKVGSYKINYAEDMFNYNNEDSIELSGKEFFEKAFKPELYRIIENGNTYENHTKEFLERTLVSIIGHTRRETISGCGHLYCGSTMRMIGINPDGSAHYCDRYNKEYEETYVMNALDYDFLGLHQLKRALDFNKIRHDVTHDAGCDTCYARDMCEGGCMGFYRSKTGENGIDKKLVCGLFKSFYDFVYDNIEVIIESFIKHNKTFSTSDTLLKLKKSMVKSLEAKGYELDVSNKGYKTTFKFLRK